MKLHHSPASPYARKVVVLLHETGQTDDVTLHPVQTTPLAPDPGLAAANPLAKIPALERADGCTLHDSRVICQFLDARAGAGFYPSGPRRWEVMTLEATGDGMTDAALFMTYEARLRPDAHRSAELVEAQWARVLRACDALQTRWMGHLSGPFDAGQNAVACALGYLDFRQPDRDWRRGRDGLAGWFETVSQRESLLATKPAG